VPDVARSSLDGLPHRTTKRGLNASPVPIPPRSGTSVDYLTPDERKRLEAYKKEQWEWRIRRHETSDTYWDRYVADSDYSLLWMLLFIALGVGAILLGLFLIPPYKSDLERLQETQSCQEVLNIMADLGRDAGNVAVAEIRYEELGCGNR